MLSNYPNQPIAVIAMLQIVAIAMVFSCVLRKLDEDDDKEEEAEANAHPEKDEEAIVKEDDPVLMLGENLCFLLKMTTFMVPTFSD